MYIGANELPLRTLRTRRTQSPPRTGIVSGFDVQEAVKLKEWISAMVRIEPMACRMIAKSYRPIPISCFKPSFFRSTDGSMVGNGSCSGLSIGAG